MTQYLSVTETAKLASLTPGRVRQLLAAGELRGEKLSGTIWLIRREDAERFCRERKKFARYY